jgi:S1-C subfamily serine protease
MGDRGIDSMRSPFARGGLLAALLFAALAVQPIEARAQLSLSQCATLVGQITDAFEGREFKRSIALARTNLSNCRAHMGTSEYIGSLQLLAMSLNFDHQYDEALGVAGLCLKLHAIEINCGYEKALALFSLGRAQEAKSVVQEYLGYPAVTENDVKGKDMLRWLLNKVAAAAPNPGPRQKDRGDGSGSGFFISDTGHIITNWHVAKGCTSLNIASGARLSIVASDPALDLALLQAKGVKPHAVASMRDTDTVLGEPIIVFGFPLTGLLSSSGNLSTGIVSATAGIRDNPRHVQISAPVQPGNSGGPMLDQSGSVVGVVVAKLDAARTASVIGDIPQNVNFAIKGREVIAFLARNKLKPVASTGSKSLSTEAVAAAASSFTVHIICHG